MGLILLLAMIAVPIIEIALFIAAGERFGLWPTLAVVILTALAGSALLRIQGFTTFVRAQESLAAGRFPVDEVFDGLCLLVAGALLLTPGFFTDAIGLLLFVPPLRKELQRTVGRYLVASGRVHTYTNAGPNAGPGPGMDEPPRRPPPGGAGPVIDGEYEEVDDPGRAKSGRSAPDRQTPHSPALDDDRRNRS